MFYRLQTCDVLGKRAGKAGQFEKQINEMISGITTILEQFPNSDSQPLFPELWFEERLVRDELRRSVYGLPPGSSPDEYAEHLTLSLSTSFLKWLPGGHIGLGIYLKTPEEWRLCGAQPIRDQLPERVRSTATTQNAYDWVRASLRSLLLQPDSRRWDQRAAECGPEIENAMRNPEFTGMTIVPLLHSQQQRDCIGLVVLSARSAPLFPAHVYLLNRLSITVAGYLTPFLLPGFNWLPDAKLNRGKAIVDSPLPRSIHVPSEAVQAVIQDIMPARSRVTVTALGGGHSSSDTFRLNVSDETGISEIARVLKVGEAPGIEDEVGRYFRYVHNKKVGGASRVDVARGFTWPREVGLFSHGKQYAAIVYTFVGAGDQAEPWAQWVRHSTVEEIGVGIDMLRDQLSCWHDRTKRRDDRTIVDHMIRPLPQGRLKNYLDPGIAVFPTFNEVNEKLTELGSLDWSSMTRPCKTCPVHGDLHADNIFAILSPTGQLRGVALIDWGSVASGRHPLSDISKLVVDLAYRIRLNSRFQARLFRHVEHWGQQLGCDRADWQFALIHQISKILFYKSGSHPGEPYIDAEARSQAWMYLKTLADSLMMSAKKNGGDHRNGRRFARKQSTFVT